MKKLSSRETQKARTRAARLALILAVLLVVYGAAGFWVTWGLDTYDKYVQSRDQTFIVHDPFSRKLFDIDSSRVHLVYLIHRFSTGTEHPNVDGRYEFNHGYANLESDKYIEEAVDLLNSFEFTFVRKQFDYEIWSQGKAYLQVFYDRKTQNSGSIVSQKLPLSYMPDRLFLGEFAYYGDKEFFEKLCALGEKYTSYSSSESVPVY